MKITMKYFGPKSVKVDEVRMKILNALRAQNTVIEGDFDKITRTWNHKPIFKAEIHLTETEPSVAVSTDDEIFSYLDKGTRGHRVPKTGFAIMRFHSKYTAKTSPRLIGSRSGGPSGPFWFSKAHYVKGIEKREYMKTIKDIRQKGFNRAMQEAIKDGLANIWEK